jgi:hypothetical protein
MVEPCLHSSKRFPGVVLIYAQQQLYLTFLTLLFSLQYTHFLNIVCGNEYIDCYQRFKLETSRTKITNFDSYPVLYVSQRLFWQTTVNFVCMSDSVICMCQFESVPQSLRSVTEYSGCGVHGERLYILWTCTYGTRNLKSRLLPTVQGSITNIIFK